jgi:hypothetical protein
VGCHRSQLGRQPAGVSDAARRHAEWLEHGSLHVGWERLSSHIGDHVVKQAVAQVRVLVPLAGGGDEVGVAGAGVGKGRAAELRLVIEEELVMQRHPGSVVGDTPDCRGCGIVRAGVEAATWRQVALDRLVEIDQATLDKQRQPAAKKASTGTAGRAIQSVPSEWLAILVEPSSSAVRPGLMGRAARFRDS